MQISTIEGIVEGKLLNAPSISFITQINTNHNKIHDGDLFISNNFDDIKVALQNGAFAILFDCNSIDISLDTEIAWIKVDDIYHATIKLSRYLISQKDNKSFYCDMPSFALLHTLIHNKKTLKFLTSDILDDFNTLKNLKNNEVLISSNKKYSLSINPLSQNINLNISPKVSNLTVHSLFVTSFLYKKYHFSHIRLPYLYLKQFLEIVDFISVHKFIGIHLDISLLKNFNYISPIFIDNHYNVVDFGKSNRFILSCVNSQYMHEEIEFIKSYYGFGKLDIISNFNDYNDLLNLIKKSNFNALYIVGKTKDEIIKLLKSSVKTDKLALFS
jgi:ferrochelatase